MSDKNHFEYTYSAPTSTERREIENIRNSYIPKTKNKNKLDTLRKLDGKVKNIPIIVSLCLGIFGTLIFGVGMTLILEWAQLVWGIIVCVVGIVPTLLAYPTNIYISKKMKEKYANKIIELSNELLNYENK